MNRIKKLLVVLFVACIGLPGYQTAAARGWGGGGGYGGDCPYGCYGANMQQLDEATIAKHEAFRADTVELRKQMAMKRAEKRALMNSQNPDPAAVAQVEGELFDLRTQMQAKAKEAGVVMMGGQGRGWGGKGGHGGRMMGCGNQQRWN